MRVGWATPFHDQSAAGRHALEVVLEMRRRGVDVEIIRTDHGENARSAAYSDAVPVRRLDDVGTDALRDRFDLLVATLADQSEANFASLEVLRSIPAVGIFHSQDLGQLSEGMARAGVGEDLIGRLQRVGATPESAQPGASKDLAWVAALCLGVVVHSRRYLEPVQAHCPGRAIVIPLCVRDRGRPPARRSERDFTIVAPGPMFADEQAGRVMRAIAQSALLKDRAVCRMVGAMTTEERARIVSLAGELGIRPPEFRGSVTEEDFHAMLGEAHAVCCLSHSALEGGSTHLVLSLCSGTPVVVAGAAADVPDELVWNVSCGTEVGDVTRALISIAENQSEADTRAAAARDWACRNHAVPGYVDELMPLLEESLEIAPMFDAGRQLGATLHAIGAALDERAAARIGDVLQELFAVRREARE